MVHSMTAFARVEKAGAQGTLSWELRSVNSRYLEPHLRLPESFRDLEGGYARHCARACPGASWNAPCASLKKALAKPCKWTASAPRNWSPPPKPSPA